ncbi:uncharacterized protein LOC134247755 [Saccostrea cucullata]|uniref:uncharacterized protein LOC134247755 n=1 Tax=Saccostrea cuccullata TaxID=36930 RepID=UPI002ED46F75
MWKQSAPWELMELTAWENVSEGFTENSLIILYSEEGKGSINEWVDFTYALIGSVTTVSMSLICLLFFLKSWLSKTNVSSTETNQLCTDQTDNPGEHDNESRSSSSNANEPVLQRTPTHSYTGLRFSRMQPLYDNSKDYESVPEQDTPSVDSLPSHKLRNDDDGESKGDGKYEGLFKNKAYNILSLRIHPLDKAKTLRSVDSSINLWDNMDGMEDEYESIEVKEDNKEECVSERRMVKIHPTGKYVCGEYSTDGTLKDYIGNAQMNKNCDMIVDKEAISQSFIAHELDCTKSFSPRPYSLANSIWRKHHTSEMSKQLRISDYEKVLTLQTGEENFVNDRIFSKTDTQIITESSADPMMSEVSGNNENKNPLKLNKNKAMIFKEAYEKKY